MIDSLKECAICLEDIKIKNGHPKNGITLACNHIFHQKCFKKWDQQTPPRHDTTCPCCRKVVIKEAPSGFLNKVYAFITGSITIVHEEERQEEREREVMNTLVRDRGFIFSSSPYDLASFNLSARRSSN
jgi:hypothetical protein